MILIYNSSVNFMFFIDVFAVSNYSWNLAVFLLIELKSTVILPKILALIMAPIISETTVKDNWAVPLAPMSFPVRIRTVW
jgi:hypothetical protein